MLKIVALGNELYGDDGIGPAVLKTLHNEVDGTAELILAGNDAFILLDHLLKQDPLVIIDCARMGKSPGEILKFRSGQIQPRWLAAEGLSLHGFSIGEILTMAAELGCATESTVIGIEPKSILFNTGLSAEISQKIPAIIDLVMEEIKNYAKKSIDH